MVKNIFICGPGRNGSTSMFYLLANCKNTYVKHFCPVTKETKIKDGFKDRSYKYRISIGPDNIDRIKNGKNTRGIFLSRPKREIINSFKKFGDKIKGQDIEQYVEEYIEKAKKMQGENFKIFDVSLLNSKEGQKAIFDYLGIEEEDRRYMKDCHYNKS